jgi:hypothetical protein
MVSSGKKAGAGRGMKENPVEFPSCGANQSESTPVRRFKRLAQELGDLGQVMSGFLTPVESLRCVALSACRKDTWVVDSERL